MTKCANCREKATLLYSLSNTHNLYYCGKHAPRSVRHLLITLSTEEEVAAEVAAVKKSTKKSTASTVINSTPEEGGVDSNSNENEPTEEEVTDNEPDN